MGPPGKELALVQEWRKAMNADELDILPGFLTLEGQLL